MARIAIIGAGRIGTATAKILLSISDHELLLIDTDATKIETALMMCETLDRPAHRVAFSPVTPVQGVLLQDEEFIQQVLKSLNVALVICAAPFTKVANIAAACVELNVHYIDFTEDVQTSKQLQISEDFTKTIVPQTGLAPGLVSYIGLALLDEIGEPASLDLRVGALPAVAFGPHFYAETWSIEGLINQCLKSVEIKKNGEIHECRPLSDVEQLIVNGVPYEAFCTSGGVGNIESYDDIPNVSYKTIRYPGHLAWLKKFFAKYDNDAALIVPAARRVFEKTRDDCVILVAHAVDVDRNSASASMIFSPIPALGLTALELCTAGTGVAIAELALAGELESGILTARDIPIDAFMGTAAMTLVIDSTE